MNFFQAAVLASLLLSSCYAHSLPENEYCNLQNLDSNFFTKSRDFKRVLEVLKLISQDELVDKDIVVYREYPNGGKDDKVKSIVLLISESSIIKYTFSGASFKLIAKNKITKKLYERLYTTHKKIKFEFIEMDCACMGGVDGIVVHLNHNQSLKYGLIFNCYPPSNWEKEIGIKHNFSILSNMILKY